MTSFSASHLLHILLAVFDYEDVPRIVFRYPYVSEESSTKKPSFPPGDETVSESVLLDSLLMYSYILSSHNQLNKLLLSVDQLLLLGHVEVISDKRWCFVFILRADTPVVVLDRFYEMSRLIAQVRTINSIHCSVLN